MGGFNIIGGGEEEKLIGPFFDYMVEVISKFKWWIPQKNMSFDPVPLPSREEIEAFKAARIERQKEGKFIAEMLLPFVSVSNAPNDDLAEQVIEHKWEVYREMQKNFLEQWLLKSPFKAAATVDRFNDISEARMDYYQFRESMLWLSVKLEKWFSKNGEEKVEAFDIDLLEEAISKSNN